MPPAEPDNQRLAVLLRQHGERLIAMAADVQAGRASAAVALAALLASPAAGTSPTSGPSSPAQQPDGTAAQARPPKPLKGSALRCAAYVSANPGRTGQEIADAVGIEFSTFRQHTVPKLKAHGYVNKPGRGYHPPPKGPRVAC